MGAWGEGAYDNDTALDLLGCVGDVLAHSLRWAFWSKHQEAGVAAGALLLDLPNEIRPHCVEQLAAEALEVVEQAIADAPDQGWRDGPAGRIAKLKALQSSLNRLYKSSKRQNTKARRRLKAVFASKGTRTSRVRRKL